MAMTTTPARAPRTRIARAVVLQLRADCRPTINGTIQAGEDIARSSLMRHMDLLNLGRRKHDKRVGAPVERCTRPETPPETPVAAEIPLADANAELARCKRELAASRRQHRIAAAKVQDLESRLAAMHAEPWPPMPRV